jgi:type II secretory pathway pseudopilin PulG
MPVRERHTVGTRQRGAAFLLLVITLVLGAAAVFYGFSKPSSSEAEKNRKTMEALEQARTALIGYAVSRALNGGGAVRPGDLPCPDTNDDGNTEGNCGNAAGSQQANRLGRLPWRSLGLPDLRDGDGERLWYAVSNNFKYSTRTNCAAPGAAGCLNSDARGTITVRNSTGTVMHDGANPNPFVPSGAVAVVFSPGAVLRRQGAAATQNRSCTGGSCNAQGACTTTPFTTTPKCNPVNYLDTNGTEDNANFVDGSAANGFINGIVRDAGGNIIVNDRLLVIRYEDIMPQLERRVVAEALNCLTLYAAANFGRYPWAATNISAASYPDATNALFGRLPTTMAQTTTTAPAMSNLWPAACAAQGTVWWNNWKDHVFYGVADAYKPAAIPPAGCPACLTVNPPSAATNKQVVVIVAGKRLSGVAGGQPRATLANRSDAANYLEGGNDTHPTFAQQPGSAAFNDTVLYR